MKLERIIWLQILSILISWRLPDSDFHLTEHVWTEEDLEMSKATENSLAARNVRTEPSLQCSNSCKNASASGSATTLQVQFQAQGWSSNCFSSSQISMPWFRPLTSFKNFPNSQKLAHNAPI